MSEVLASLQEQSFARATAATNRSYPPERRLSGAQLLPTMAGSVRERHLRGTPWLTMVIAEGDHSDHVVVIVEGPTEIDEPSQVPADVRAAVTGDWVTGWIRLTAQRMLSYAEENAVIGEQK